MEREQDRNYNCFRWRNIRINIIFICHVVTLTLEREILYEENIIGKINYFKSYLKVSERLLDSNLKVTYSRQKSLKLAQMKFIVTRLSRQIKKLNKGTIGIVNNTYTMYLFQKR